jgi:ligand-binding SRPBCC domain-containing protein
MPRFVTAVDLSVPLNQAFAFFRNPVNLIRVAPPALQLQLESGPAEVQLGSQMTLVGRRWGLRYRSVIEVIAFEPDACFIEEQMEGTFRKWIHAHRFRAFADGATRVLDEIDYEPPGGMLGLLLTPAAVEHELKEYFHHRNGALAEILTRT